MGRRPQSNHPMLPWVIIVTAGAIAFHIGMSVAVLVLAFIAALMRWPPGLGWTSLRRIDALVANPLTLTFILAAGIATAIWASMIAWRTLKSRGD